MKAKILIISDEIETARVWEYSLNQVGLDTRLISTADPVIEIWNAERPDLIIIEDFNDIVVELDLCRQLRALVAIPILFLTTRSGETHLLDIYNNGADEAIPFPLTPRLFRAKVKAWLRQTGNLPMSALDDVIAGAFTLDPEARHLRKASGEEYNLTILESRLLYILMGHPRKAFGSDELIDRVWGYFGHGNGTVLKNLVYRIRRKIEPRPDQPRYLLTEGNYGYKFQAE